MAHAPLPHIGWWVSTATCCGPRSGAVAQAAQADAWQIYSSKKAIYA
jgi:hypothetical protein